jgi:3-hydroxybutyryl-CoA dehydrogenase
MSIRSIIVCGAGTMGSGIAQVAARHGHETALYDLDPAALERAERSIREAWQGLVEKGRMSDAQRAAALEKLRFVRDLQGADLVIEAIVERLDAKIALFHSLAEVCTAEAIFVSNTSSLSIDALQEALPHPERVAGLHFFNPAPLMKLVEVVRGRQTDPGVLATLEALVSGWEKVPVVCKDAPGFIVNRVARPFYLEALRLAQAGGDYASIDRILEASGFRMGPFRLMDLIGNDVNLAVTRSLYEAYGKATRFQPSPLQEALVARGDLGRKTGKGYYSYTST